MDMLVGLLPAELFSQLCSEREVTTLSEKINLLKDFFKTRSIETSGNKKLLVIR
jgi:hypothetical protein